MIALLGMDDTDNSTSRGTGYHARTIAESLREQGIAKPRAVTRHQLLVHPEIRYTSRNSCICVSLEIHDDDASRVLKFAASELDTLRARGSNAALALSPAAAITDEVQEFGRRAKAEVLDTKDAETIAQRRGIALRTLSGGGAGAIGSLAALGLHSSGEDGRFIWLPQLRELSGTYRVDELAQVLDVGIETASGNSPPLDSELELSVWVRPIMRDGHAILLVEKVEVDDEIRWRLADKQAVKALSD